MRVNVDAYSIIAYGIKFYDLDDLREFIEDIRWDENDSRITDYILDRDTPRFDAMGLFYALDPKNELKPYHELMEYGAPNESAFILTPYWRRKGKKKNSRNACITRCLDGDTIKLNKDFNVPNAVIENFQYVLKLHNLPTKRKLHWYLCTDMSY